MFISELPLNVEFGVFCSVLALEKVDDKVPFDPVRFSEKLDPEEKLKQMAAFLTFHKS